MKEKNKKILYYIFLILGLYFIFSTLVEIFLGTTTLTKIASGFLIGFLLLVIAVRVKPKIKK